MLFHNVDHVKDDDLNILSQKASSMFFVANARFCDMLSKIETFELKQAVGYANVCIAILEDASHNFRQLADKIKGMVWLRNEVRAVDQKLASFEAALSPDLPELSDIKATIVRGDFHLVFDSCANDIGVLSVALMSVVANLERATDNTNQLEYRPIHELIGQWRVLTIKGQQVSAAVGIAQTIIT